MAVAHKKLPQNKESNLFPVTMGEGKGNNGLKSQQYFRLDVGKSFFLGKMLEL